jgi:pimeloyl-ACP methyl ester carboxylesterase
MTEVRNLKIETLESDLIDLKNRLLRSRWPDEVPLVGWVQGTDLSYLMELTSYWRDQFSWRSQESKLNEFRHFLAEVDGLKLHFIHEKGRGPRPVPLILIHGWPSSFAELLKVIPLLTDPGSHGGDPRDSFNVIVPSLPGYGYSDAPRNSGMSIWHAADLLYKLMKEVLGYHKFAASGGDWGAYAASYLGFKSPEQILAIHLSFIPGGLHPGISSAQIPYSEAELELLADRKKWNQVEGGMNIFRAQNLKR